MVRPGSLDAVGACVDHRGCARGQRRRRNRGGAARARRNQVRLPPYDRLDLRIRKVFLFRWGVFTLSGEVLNVLNRKNEYNVESTLLTVARTGQYLSGLRKGFPVAPSIGLSVQF